MVRDRIQHIYEKNEERLLKIYKTAYKSLVGLVDNQIQLVNVNMPLEHMNSMSMHERPSKNEESSKHEELKRSDPVPYIRIYTSSNQEPQDKLWSLLYYTSVPSMNKQITRSDSP